MVQYLHSRILEFPSMGGWGSLYKRKTEQKIIYRSISRSIDGFINPVSLCASVYPSIALSVYLWIYLSVPPSIYVPVCQPIRFISPFFHLSSPPSIYSPGYLCNRLSVSVYLSIDRSTHETIFLAIYLSIYPSLHPSVHLLIYGSMGNR